jgi:hypothetical protein
MFVSGVAITIVVGFGPWVTATFSGQIVTPSADCSYACAEFMHTESLPADLTVSVHWEDQSSGRVTFGISEPGEDLSMNQCTWHNETNGSCTFESVGGTYTFFASNFIGTTDSQIVDYSGSYPSSIF